MVRGVGALLLGLACVAVPAQERSLPAGALRSGSTYLSPELRAMQEDGFANPGMLWVEKGAKLWGVRAGADGRSCADCHGDARASMRGVAARYPAFDRAANRLLDLEGRINQCRAERQRAAPFAFESEELLGLTAHVASQSRGLPLKVAVDGPAAPHFARGRMLFERRIGQMNLACLHCHEWNAGRRLLAETISQGHPNAYPIYRLEWQSAGSLQRRLRACYSGVRAELPAYNSADLLDLSLFLAWRAEGLAIETPGVRR
ncbi:MAG: sulfur oxidation c-type cytochrome SoxA [Burkholderiales bacterium]|nr:sulfur oxidation c-type cytochrome SoxA [Burkholderiales bacterium]